MNLGVWFSLQPGVPRGGKRPHSSRFPPPPGEAVLELLPVPAASERQASGGASPTASHVIPANTLRARAGSERTTLSSATPSGQRVQKSGSGLWAQVAWLGVIVLGQIGCAETFAGSPGPHNFPAGSRTLALGKAADRVLCTSVHTVGADHIVGTQQGGLGPPAQISSLSSQRVGSEACLLCQVCLLSRERPGTFLHRLGTHTQQEQGSLGTDRAGAGEAGWVGRPAGPSVKSGVAVGDASVLPLPPASSALMSKSSEKKNHSCFVDLSANFNLHSGVKCRIIFMHLVELLHRCVKTTILYRDFVSDLYKG